MTISPTIYGCFIIYKRSWSHTHSSRHCRLSPRKNFPLCVFSFGRRKGEGRINEKLADMRKMPLSMLEGFFSPAVTCFHAVFPWRIQIQPTTVPFIVFACKSLFYSRGNTKPIACWIKYSNEKYTRSLGNPFRIIPLNISIFKFPIAKHLSENLNTCKHWGGQFQSLKNEAPIFTRLC